MIGNIIGDEFDDWVKNQIKARQFVAGSGYGKSNTRNPKILNYLNNRNAWIKLGSSVSVLPNANEQLDTIIQKKIRKALKLPPKQYEGKVLAKKAVLFNTIQELVQTKDNKAGTYKPRKGVYNSSNSIFKSQDHIIGIGGPGKGPVPPPGIISMNKDVLEKGSTEKVTIHIKAYNTFQFELIELLYMRLGFFMLIEWGWDKYVYYDKDGALQFADTGTTVIDKYWFNENQVTGDVHSRIKEMRKRYHGNYDGFIGKVQNMDYKLNSDLSYDITLNLIGKGSIIEALSANRKTSRYIVDETSIDRYKDITEIQSGKIISNAGENAISKFIFDTITTYYPNIPGSFIATKKYVLVKREKNEYTLPAAGKDFIKIPNSVKNNLLRSRFGQISTTDRNLNSNAPAFDLINADITRYTKSNAPKGGKALLNNKPPDSKRYYIRFKYLLDFINTNIIPGYQNGDAKEPLTRISTEEDFNLIFLPEKNISFDSSICIHTLSKKYHSTVDNLTDEDQTLLEEQTNNVQGTGYFSDIFNPMKLDSTYMYEFDAKIFNSTEAKERGGGVFKIMNLYMNMDFISDASTKFQDANGKVSLFDFLKYILQQINAAFGYTLKLMPYINEDQEIIIFNQNPALNLKTNKLKPLFNLAGYTSLKNNSTGVRTSTAGIIRNFDFASKISPKLGQMMAIGAAAPGSLSSLEDGTLFGNMNQGVIDSYQQQFVDPPDASPKNNDFTDDVEALNKIFIDKSKNNLSSTTSIVGVLGFLSSPIIGTAVGKSAKVNLFLASLISITDPQTGYSKRGLTQVEWVEKALAERKRQYAIAEKIADANTSRLTKENDFATALANLLGGVPPLTNTVTGTIVRQNQPNPIYGVDMEYFAMNGSTATVAKSLFQRYIINKNNYQFQTTGKTSNLTGFIPVEAKLSLDGLSGPKPLSLLSLDSKFLPINYPELFNFLVQGLNHKVENNDWTTEINILSTPNISASEVAQLIAPQDSKPPKKKKKKASTNQNNDSSSESGNYSESVQQGNRLVKNVLPDNAVNLSRTWNNSKKRALITESGKEVWPIVSGRTRNETEPVFWYPDENGDPYAVNRQDKEKIKNGKNVSRSYFYKNSEYSSANLKDFSALIPGLNSDFSLFDIKGKKTNLSIEDSIKLTLSELNQQGLNNKQYFQPSGKRSVYREIGGSPGNLSGHAFGLAIDINPANYPDGLKARAKYDAVADGKREYTWKGKTISISEKEYKQGRTIKVFATIKSNGYNVWEWGYSFKDVHHFTINGYKM